MHIPDGYLSPQTFIPLTGVFIVITAIAVKKVKKEVSVKNIPFLGMAAAFSFIIMMFNLPIPGGTTGHAVGAAMVSIILGPWSASIAISVALIIQALIFGDGGITAIGANCFNIAIVMPFVAYYTFRLFCKNPGKKNNVFISAFISGYFSLFVAAILTAVEFGIQPLIASSPYGRALYCPYGLSIALPAMAIEHLLLFCIVEGIVTAVILRYFVKNEPELIYAFRKEGTVKLNKIQKKILLALFVICLITPIGILLPIFFNAGDAWGEWSAQTLSDLIGYVPEGLAKYTNIWKAPLPDYTVNSEDASIVHQSGYYIVSGIIGATITYIVMLTISKIIVRNAK